MSARTAAELWAVLTTAGLTSGDMPAAGEKHTPWYVRVMLGVAGLIAAIFLLGFIGVGVAFVIKSQTASIAVGLMVITASYAIFRLAPRNDFSTMFALAVSLAGQALVIFGLFGVFSSGHEKSFPWGTVALFEAALALVIPNFTHRAISAFGAGAAFGFACGAWGANAIAPGVVAAAIAYIWLNEMRLGRLHSVVTPVGYGLTLAFVLIEGMAQFGHTMMMMFGPRAQAAQLPGVGESFVALALFVSVWMLFKRAAWPLHGMRTALALVAAAVIGIASWKAPGIAGGLMIALLGYANGNRGLTALGIVALLMYVSSYYYLLETTLLVKAGVLLATGLVLLAVRWVMLNVVMPPERTRA